MSENGYDGPVPDGMQVVLAPKEATPPPTKSYDEILRDVVFQVGLVETEIHVLTEQREALSDRLDNLRAKRATLISSALTLRDAGKVARG
jgi:hypothetical protein